MCIRWMTADLCQETHPLPTPPPPNPPRSSHHPPASPPLPPSPTLSRPSPPRTILTLDTTSSPLANGQRTSQSTITPSSPMPSLLLVARPRRNGATRAMGGQDTLGQTLGIERGIWWMCMRPRGWRRRGRRRRGGRCGPSQRWLGTISFIRYVHVKETASLNMGVRASADSNRLLELQRASQQTGINCQVCSTARIPKERRSRSGSRPTRRAQGRAEPSMDSRACMLRPLSLFSKFVPLAQVCIVLRAAHRAARV